MAKAAFIRKRLCTDFQSGDVRAEARTLQENEFSRSLFSRAVKNGKRTGLKGV